MKIFYFNPDADIYRAELRVNKSLEDFTVSDVRMLNGELGYPLELSANVFEKAFNEGEINGGAIKIFE